MSAIGHSFRQRCVEGSTRELQNTLQNADLLFKSHQ